MTTREIVIVNMAKLNPSMVKSTQVLVTSALRHERVNRGISMRGVAKAIGVDPSNLSKFERGQAWYPGMARKYQDYLWPREGSS
jgi:ribosome-binding protein aMBF1 (putative translation factor)